MAKPRRRSKSRGEVDQRGGMRGGREDHRARKVRIEHPGHAGFFRYLINATEPTTGAALPRPATAERNARGEKTRKRYIQIAAALKTEAGITQYTAHKEMTGGASLATGAIFAPAGTTRRQLYVLAHECGHIALHSALKSRRKPRHVEEQARLRLDVGSLI